MIGIIYLYTLVYSTPGVSVAGVSKIYRKNHVIHLLNNLTYNLTDML